MNDREIAHFLHLETSLHKLAVRRSTEAASALLADEFIEFGSSGRVFDKRAIIESMSREEVDQKILVENFVAKELASAVVLVTYVGKKAVEGEAAIASLRSSIWRRVDGKWCMVFHQGTRIPSVPEVSKS